MALSDYHNDPTPSEYLEAVATTLALADSHQANNLYLYRAAMARPAYLTRTLVAFYPVNVPAFLRGTETLPSFVLPLPHLPQLPKPRRELRHYLRSDQALAITDYARQMRADHTPSCSTQSSTTLSSQHVPPPKRNKAATSDTSLTSSTGDPKPSTPVGQLSTALEQSQVSAAERLPTAGLVFHRGTTGGRGRPDNLGECSPLGALRPNHWHVAGQGAS